ncbi:hypothetical protein ACIO3R_01455 [Streptomyces sp. NPDC087428]|uniref:hypothetical protein n=1 Tax=Streptomyces sp. NPDC087428 TaxID=3365788 RepID=UPI00381A7448
MSAASIDPARIERAAVTLGLAMKAGNAEPYSLAAALEMAGLLAAPSVPAELEKTTAADAEAEVTSVVAVARTVVLSALARTLREQPTGARILQGLDELGEALICEDLAEVRSWVDGISLLAGLPAAADTGLTYYRASHDSIAIGRYTTADVARRRCETWLSDEHPDDAVLLFDWMGDEDDPEEPWELVVQVDGGDEQPTGYVVQALRIEADIDPDAEW